MDFLILSFSGVTIYFPQLNNQYVRKRQCVCVCQYSFPILSYCNKNSRKKEEEEMQNNKITSTNNNDNNFIWYN